jgi:hypothetical protein
MLCCKHRSFRPLLEVKLSIRFFVADVGQNTDTSEQACRRGPTTTYTEKVLVNLNV